MVTKKLGKQFSAKQIYDFTIVKNATVTLGFDHPPSKNADGVILKYGTGSVDSTGVDTYDGKVQGGYLYYLSGTTWHKATHETADLAGIKEVNYGQTDQYIPAGINGPSAAGWPAGNTGLGHGQGKPHLLGYALGTPGEREGRADEVGMLLGGIVTAYIFGSPGPYHPGAPVFGAPGNSKGGGFITMTTASVSSLGNVRRVIGHCIDCVDKSADGTCAGTTKILMYFNPSDSYIIL